MATRYVTVNVKLVKQETNGAYLFVIDNADHWVPKSQLEEDEGIGAGDEDIEVSVTKWFADKEDITY